MPGLDLSFAPCLGNTVFIHNLCNSYLLHAPGAKTGRQDRFQDLEAKTDFQDLEAKTDFQDLEAKTDFQDLKPKIDFADREASIDRKRVSTPSPNRAQGHAYILNLACMPVQPKLVMADCCLSGESSARATRCAARGAGRSRARAARARAHGAVDVVDATPGGRRRRGGRRLRGHRGHDAARRALGGARRRAGVCAPGRVRRVYLWKCRADVYQDSIFLRAAGPG